MYFTILMRKYKRQENIRYFNEVDFYTLVCIRRQLIFERANLIDNIKIIG